MVKDREQRERPPCKMIMPIVAPSIDVYLTYRCNLRCGHCFVGNSLTNSDGHFPWPSLEKLIAECGPRWMAQQIVFLGGEPTLHPQLVRAIQFAHVQNLSTQFVTNGQRPLGGFLDSFDGDLKPKIGFSIDGSNPAVHDAIRGRGTFAKAIKSVERALDLGYRCHFVSSISRQNAHDVVGILKLADRLAVSYVNVHYVSARGFAPNSIVLTIDEWLDVGSQIASALPGLSTPIRWERTFYENGAQTPCQVRDRSSLLFFPDGRVFMCPMFIDVPDAHALLWSERGLESNVLLNEEDLCRKDTSGHCPAMKFVNPAALQQANDRRITVGCIFDKQKLVASRDDTVLDAHAGVASA